LGDEGGEFYGAARCGFGVGDVGVDVGVVVVAVGHLVGGGGGGGLGEEARGMESLIAMVLAVAQDDTHYTVIYQQN
jgi:hypothetical protein